MNSKTLIELRDNAAAEGLNAFPVPGVVFAALLDILIPMVQGQERPPLVRISYRGPSKFGDDSYREAYVPASDAKTELIAMMRDVEAPNHLVDQAMSAPNERAFVATLVEASEPITEK